MKAFIYWWGREDILFAAATVPAACAWILAENLFVGIVTWGLSYAAIVVFYEWIAQKREWPHAAVTGVAKEIWRSYNPL